ncbi:MAG TPA: aminoglycoside phosphotransferase family protein [Aggregatilineales bacterium]|nr:aminoglycoside phosphotransferase family protein [Aggregatilineales bacterium]
MLEKPAIQDHQLLACLREEFGLNATQITFLPIGNDANSALFRAETGETSAYFVKLRSGDFDEMTVVVPRLLRDQNITAIIAPLSTRSGQLWTSLDNFKVCVFPFVEGHTGYDIALLDRHWIDFGRALKALHSAALPPMVTDRIQRERYADRWRSMVRQFQTLAEERQYDDPVAADLAEFLRDKKAEISHLVQRAEQLASVLATQSEPFVLCHADIHGRNILIDADNRLYLVDWDTLTLAPKERDLMFVGGGLIPNPRPAQEEERLFYQGYGQTQINAVALSYYRFERIVEDVASYSEQILMTDRGGKDRASGLQKLMNQFRPDNVVEIACRTEKQLPEPYRARF